MHAEEKKIDNISYLDHEVRIGKSELINDMLHETLMRIESKLDKLEEKMDSRFMWSLGSAITLMISLAGYIIKRG